MVASVSLDPPSDAGRAAAMDALHRGPNGSGAGGDRAFLFSAVPLSLIAARVARARVTFTVTSEKKIDRVNVRLVDPLGDGGLTPGKDWAARALAGEACALGEIDGVAAGTRVSFVFDRAAAGYDAGTTRDDAPVPNTGDARDPFGGPISLFGLGGFGDAGTNTHAPQIRMEAVSVNGRLPPEVIVRIVRQNFGRFRLCYQHGLDASPALKGRVAVKFVIGADGSVTSVSGGGSDMPDPGVVGCVTAGFRNLSFPAPEGGVVSVVFPLVFTPPS
jgi:hypothetical protein